MPEHADLYTFRDLDLLVKLSDAGAATSAELANAVGLSDAQPMAIRLSWMRRFGMVDRDEEAGAWTVSAGGNRVVRARLRAAQSRAIEAVPDEAMVDVMAHVATRYRMGDPIIATMLRREFLYGTRRL